MSEQNLMHMFSEQGIEMHENTQYVNMLEDNDS